MPEFPLQSTCARFAGAPQDRAGYRQGVAGASEPARNPESPRAGGLPRVAARSAAADRAAGARRRQTSHRPKAPRLHFRSVMTQRGVGLPRCAGKAAPLKPAGDASGVIVAGGKGAATVVPNVSVAGVDIVQNGLNVVPVAPSPM